MFCSILPTQKLLCISLLALRLSCIYYNRVFSRTLNCFKRLIISGLRVRFNKQYMDTRTFEDNICQRTLNSNPFRVGALQQWPSLVILEKRVRDSAKWGQIFKNIDCNYFNYFRLDY
jgi:hypothetical protein